jgi:Arc/MetJ-type ribon-helix-helix transcriptional regulator
MSSFEDLELQKLNQVVNTFTASEMNKYKEEVDYIRYLLQLLRQEKSKPQTKKQKEAEKKTEKKIKESLSNLINTFTLKKPTTKTHDALPENVMDI